MTPIAFLNGYGPRVAESGLGLIRVHALIRHPMKTWSSRKS